MTIDLWQANHPSPHEVLLPYLARWPRLESFIGMRLWALDLADVLSIRTLEIAMEIGAACPSLKKVSWVDGTVVLRG